MKKRFLIAVFLSRKVKRKILGNTCKKDIYWRETQRCIEKSIGTSLVVQWVGLHDPNAGVLGSIPGWGTRSCMHASTKKFACPN